MTMTQLAQNQEVEQKIQIWTNFLQVLQLTASEIVTVED